MGNPDELWQVLYWAKMSGEKGENAELTMQL